ncbi:2-amino-4-hydroxy-6-hydroxymethyldihydropteridine diphosphokinase [Sphingomonas sp. NFR15]|uniref:2-amino-4-hydroxy-6- hydroxymethyldihydropteridine diphosphokinase n=1 Tax=Sphingomonas sp. NFR15 TaxID=1566282 RepID=UPI000885760F|nr:2-amino-4-hydroxy-6-hydroxymethyldihydropteridine diphosphokinase [Sphingomonas sp. NFR15]SDA34067.1 2-amino-4-hydroxy-6-hydroxymethyldihydropteridinediphosphokinase [Sphingomonas sp. NFR15]
MPTSYALALGSNRRGRHGAPAAELRAAITALGRLGDVRAVAPVFDTAPLGPSSRRFANSAVVLETEIDPADLIAALKAIERAFGRRRGRRWGERVIDLDIILWSGGRVRMPHLAIPHPAFRARRFVLDPLARIAPLWRDPQSGRTIRQLAARIRAVDRRANRP